jgi:DNA-directed RNA polymerase, mitochondrial
VNSHHTAPTLDDQIQLEYSTIDAARSKWMADKLKARAKGEEEDTDYGTAMIRGAIGLASAEVARRIAAILKGRPTGGRVYKIVPILRTLDPEITAFIALRTVVANLSKPQDLMSLALTVGGRVEDQLKLDAFQQQYPDNYKITQKRIKKMSVVARARRRALMRIMSNRAGTAFNGWEKVEKTHLGIMLLECVRDATHIITFDYVAKNNRGRVTSRHLVTPTPQAEDFVRWADDAYSLSAPQHLPTIVRPKKWTNPRNGGYWSGLLPLALIKKPTARVLDEMGNREMPQVYAALNRMQDTPWQINKRVYGVYKYAVENHLAIGGIPPMAPVDIPAKPHDKDTNEAALKAWKAQAAQVHTDNNKSKSKRFQVTTILDIATRFSAYSEFSSLTS